MEKNHFEIVQAIMLLIAAYLYSDIFSHGFQFISGAGFDIQAAVGQRYMACT
jgi:hypothetical protein